MIGISRRIVLIVEGDEATWRNVKTLLLCGGIQAADASGNSGCPTSAISSSPGLAIVHAGHGTLYADGVQLTREIRQVERDTTIILLVKLSFEEKILAAFRAGVTDYFKEPVSRDELIGSLNRHVREPDAGSAGKTLRGSRASSPDLIDGWRMVGDSVAIRETKTAIQNVAPTDSTVLITGETGTGKELVADLIHKNSSLSERPFVCLNCAAVPETLLESELFGYEKGAFTGADTGQRGKLELANAGTIFLDEIGDMSLCAQAKVLRVLENRGFYRLGGRATVSPNIRIITATHQNLDQLTEQGGFRKDLYFRLAVARIALPPLRDRKQDIPVLAEHYIRHFNRVFHREVERFDEEALECLLHYHWPGNIRELRNFIEAAFIGRPGRIISLANLPSSCRAHLPEPASTTFGERDKLLLALSTTKWNKSKAAEKLQWSRMTLYRKIAKYHLISSGADHSAENEIGIAPPLVSHLVQRCDTCCDSARPLGAFPLSRCELLAFLSVSVSSRDRLLGPAMPVFASICINFCDSASASTSQHNPLRSHMGRWLSRKPLEQVPRRRWHPNCHLGKAGRFQERGWVT